MAEKWNEQTAKSFTDLATSAKMLAAEGANDFNFTKAELKAYFDTLYQVLDATLTSISALGTAADKGIYATGVDTFAEFDLTAAGRALLDDADAAAQRTTLDVYSEAETASAIDTDIATHSGLTTGVHGVTGTVLGSEDIGVSVQAYDADTTKNDVANTFTVPQTIQNKLTVSATVSRIALELSGTMQSTNTVLQAILQAAATIDPQGASLSAAYGMFYTPKLKGGKNIASLVNVMARGDSDSYTGVLTNLINFEVKDSQLSPTNQYGYYVNNLVSGANNWAFYADGTTKSFFGGNVETNGFLMTIGKTVALLSTTAPNGSWQYATNGRKPGEGAGAGTGVPVFRASGVWYSLFSAAAVTS